MKLNTTISSVNPVFWADKKVFLTGHTGFKGGWLTLWLASMGAKVTGYSLAATTNPSFFDVANVKSVVDASYIADIRNLDLMSGAFRKTQPDILIHMAAQPLVRYSYQNPVETYSTNVMGTVNVLECVRHSSSVRSVVVVTTDKCYENREWEWGYRENEPMGGQDPYSNSKGCAELLTATFRSSYFSPQNSTHFNKNSSLNPASNPKCLASARAGNVIGGGDWSEDRLVPDAIKAFELSKPLKIRNPMSTRPWQHVLEPLSGYLTLAEKLFDQGTQFASAWNFGPAEKDARSVEEVVNLLISQWGENARWEKEGAEQPHEANFLKLDCSKAKRHLGWVPKWELETAVDKTVQWHRAFQHGHDMQKFSLDQIKHYMES